MPLPLEVAECVDVILEKLKVEGKLPQAPHQKLERAAETELNGILIEQVEHENGTLLGPLLPLASAWEALGVSEFLKDNNFQFLAGQFGPNQYF